MMRARQHIICVWGIFSIGNKSWQIPSGIVKSLTGLSAQLAVAVSNSSCNAPTLTSQADADALRACSTITGTLTIASNAAGNLQVDGVQEILGALECQNCEGSMLQSNRTVYESLNCTNLKALGSSTLKKIGGRFSLLQQFALETVSFPKLTTVGRFQWYDLPVLRNASLNSGITTLTNNPAEIIISYVDHLSQFNAFQFTDVGSLKINLSSLNDLRLPLQTANQLEIYGSGNLSLDLSALIYVDGLTITGCKSITFQNLKSFKTLDLQQNTFKTLTIPRTLSMSTVSSVSSVSIKDSPYLTSVSMPAFDVIANLAINGNPALTSIDLPNIETLVTATISGNFSTLPLPNLVSATDITVSSNQSAFDCANLDAYRKKGTISGKYSCQGKTVAVNSGAGGLRVELMTGIAAGMMLVMCTAVLM